jgi:hypothetical protein
MIVPDAFPYNLAEYISSALVMGIYVMFFIPVMLALLYYIFDFAFWRKLVMTALIMGHFILFLPFQYMLHALVISSWSFLFLPLLYLLFGLLLDTLMFISWYSFAMTWRSQEKDTQL